MIAGLPLAFAAPAVLAGLIVLPVIWWLLRMTPPRPRTEVFPPLRILAGVLKREETPSKSPWWLTLLRLTMAAFVIMALADPILNPQTSSISRDGPLVLVIDNSWASAADWADRVETAGALVDDAEDADIPVSLTLTAEADNDATPTTAAAARTRLQAARPEPNRPDRGNAAEALETALGDTAPGTFAYISDGIASPGSAQALEAMLSSGPAAIRLVEGGADNAVALTSADNGAERFTVETVRLQSQERRDLTLSAYDLRGRSIAGGTLTFRAGEKEATGRIDAPFELRNDFARIGIDGLSTAGATFLLDDSFRRRRVALLSGEARDNAQQLLSPLFYIKRALAPYADLIEPRDSDLAKAIPELIRQRPSVIVMADIGTLPDETYPLVRKWIEGGGTLLRFAGPRLAGASDDDPLVPVTLRAGERALGGTMSWGKPQPLADFPDEGPFAGMQRPDDVTVKRQVLAEPSPDLPERTWASLADGTPLVTTRTRGDGRIVLFHVTAAPTWSNLPISGSFVEMLRRTIQLSRAGGVSGSDNETKSLPPYRMLNADGVLVQPAGGIRPLEIAGNTLPETSFDNPPGLYGTEDGFRALNLLRAGDTLDALALPETSVPVTRAGLTREAAQSLKPWLFGAAMILLLADSLIVLFMAGALARPAASRRLRSGTAAALAFAVALAALPGLVRPASAADEKPGDAAILDKLDETHLAYVVTGDDRVDRVSERGLAGLSEFITYRTALEPGTPVGLDIANDPLAFYPLIYWPISADAPMKSDAAISRIDAYMKNGGTVVFDTRDELTGLDTGQASPETRRLRQILGNLDIPPLQPVPTDHVLTKAFYLLNDFPGRYRDGQMWIEALAEPDEGGARPARAGDGVSSIIITSNDLAGAWAVDQNDVPLFPTVPDNPVQREHAYRVGVNLVMYMLTGNYKADQVHIPALLERLGQ